MWLSQLTYIYSFCFQLHSLHFNRVSHITDIYETRLETQLPKIVIRVTHSCILPETYPQIKTALAYKYWITAPFSLHLYLSLITWHLSRLLETVNLVRMKISIKIIKFFHIDDLLLKYVKRFSFIVDCENYCIFTIIELCARPLLLNPWEAHTTLYNVMQFVTAKF